MGIGYGPIVVTREPLGVDELRGREIVIPGRLTTAYLVLRLVLGEDVRVRELPFDRDPRRGRVGPRRRRPGDPRGPAHLRRRGAAQGARPRRWWQSETGLPLPLGVNAARRDLGERLPDVSAVLGEAIRVGLDHRDEALAYAERFGRGIDRETADRFVAMYVNELTCDYGELGRRAVDELLLRSGSGVQASYA